MQMSNNCISVPICNTAFLVLLLQCIAQRLNKALNLLHCYNIRRLAEKHIACAAGKITFRLNLCCNAGADIGRCELHRSHQPYSAAFAYTVVMRKIIKPFTERITDRFYVAEQATFKLAEYLARCGAG